MKDVYKFPLYYEIACDIPNIKKEINSFKRIIGKFSKRKVKRVLDIACGPSMQLIELAKRGYEATGLDLNKEMLDYLQAKAKKLNLKIKTIKADMFDFKLKEKVDFAFIMLASFKAGSNNEYLNQLDSVANSLNKGGLYIIQNIGFVYIEPVSSIHWKMKRDGVVINSEQRWRILDPINQIVKEDVILHINDNGKKMKLVNSSKDKMLSLEEFKLLIEKNKKFEFLGLYPGSYDEWHFNKPIEKAKDPDLNICILRRK